MVRPSLSHSLPTTSHSLFPPNIIIFSIIESNQAEIGRLGGIQALFSLVVAEEEATLYTDYKALKLHASSALAICLQHCMSLPSSPFWELIISALKYLFSGQPIADIQDDGGSWATLIVERTRERQEESPYQQRFPAEYHHYSIALYVLPQQANWERYQLLGECASEGLIVVLCRCCLEATSVDKRGGGSVYPPGKALDHSSYTDQGLDHPG